MSVRRTGATVDWLRDPLQSIDTRTMVDAALGRRFMSSEESRMDRATDEAKAVLGCGLRTLAIWIGAVVLIAAMIGIGVWISNLFSG